MQPLTVVSLPPLKVFSYIPLTNTIHCRLVTTETTGSSDSATTGTPAKRPSTGTPSGSDKKNRKKEPKEEQEEEEVDEPEQEEEWRREKSATHTVLFLSPRCARQTCHCGTVG